MRHTTRRRGMMAPTTGWVACDYTTGDTLADVRHSAIYAEAEAAQVVAERHGYDGIRWVHTDGYLYVDPPEEISRP